MIATRPLDATAHQGERHETRVQQRDCGGEGQPGAAGVRQVIRRSAGAHRTGRAPEARGAAVVDPAEGALALGPMETNERGDGRMTGSIPEPVTGYDLVQITTEPLGSEKRSGPVYMQAKL